MKYYVVKFTGPFGFIKPWTAVRDASGGETYSQQFLTPSIVEGIRQKLEVKSILRHRLIYAGIDVQQEVVQAKAWSKKGKQYIKERSILKRGVMLYPSLYLAFEYSDDAERAALQHICLCTNELTPNGAFATIPPASAFSTALFTRTVSVTYLTSPKPTFSLIDI